MLYAICYMRIQSDSIFNSRTFSADIHSIFSFKAWGYQNEGEVGEGIKLSGVPRKEIWITSKVGSRFSSSSL